MAKGTVLREKYLEDGKERSHDFSLVSYKKGEAYFVLDGENFGPYGMPRAETTFRSINSVEDFRKTIPDVKIRVSRR
jgi:hypothetical protein